MYEYIYDYSEAECLRCGITGFDLSEFRDIAKKLDMLSVSCNRKLILFFYRDPAHELPFCNPIVFRTSAYKSKGNQPTFGLPAFINHKPHLDVPSVLPHKRKPRVNFRGTIAPLKLSRGVDLRDKINMALLRSGINFKLQNWYPRGYLLRRRAVLSCIGIPQYLETDFILNPSSKIEGYKEDYLQSFQNGDYFICAAGFGNYSYRLYEVMRSGRIPVLIDSDQLLPCDNHFSWSEVAVIIPEREVDKTGLIIKEFNESIHPDDYVEKQIKIKEFYNYYLTQFGFANYILSILLPGIKD